MKQPVAPILPTEDCDPHTLRWQRDCAFACAALSVTISSALIAANFAGSESQIVDTRRSIAEHQRLLLESKAERSANEQALVQNRTELEKLKKAVIATP